MTITDLLMLWGRSRRLGDASAIDYPRETPFSRMARNSGAWAVGTTGLTDKEHQRVDCAVSELRQKNPLRHEVLVQSYVNRKSDSGIARMKIDGRRRSRHEVKNIRIAAEAWVESRLDL